MLKCAPQSSVFIRSGELFQFRRSRLFTYFDMKKFWLQVSMPVIDNELSRDAKGACSSVMRKIRTRRTNPQLRDLFIKSGLPPELPPWLFRKSDVATAKRRKKQRAQEKATGGGCCAMPDMWHGDVERHFQSETFVRRFPRPGLPCF